MKKTKKKGRKKKQRTETQPSSPTASTTILLIVLLWKSLPVEDKFFNGLAKVVVMGDKYYLSPVDR